MTKVLVVEPNDKSMETLCNKFPVQNTLCFKKLLEVDQSICIHSQKENRSDLK